MTPEQKRKHAEDRALEVAREKQAQLDIATGKLAWAREDHVAQLGNFVTMTPALRAKFRVTGQRVPCYWDDHHVASLYDDCPFLLRLFSLPPGEPFVRTLWEGPRPDGIPDAKAYVQRAVPEYKHPSGSDIIPSPYVDTIDRPNWWDAYSQGDPVIAVAHGCLGTCWLARKTLPAMIREYMVTAPIQRGYRVLILGTPSDKGRFWDDLDIPPRLLSHMNLRIREAVGALQACRALLANDTGLAHVAGASGLPALSMFYQTHAWRFSQTYETVEQAVDNEGRPSFYASAIDDFLDRLEREETDVGKEAERPESSG